MKLTGFAKLSVAAILLLVCAAVIAQQTGAEAHENPQIESQITALLAQMTLQEKIDALGTDPSVPRLGFAGTGHVEGLHGLALGGPGGWEGRGKTVIPTTTFPQARGLGQTWDPALIEKAAELEAIETRWDDFHFHRGGLVVRAPNADLSRDPRWGRSEESYGEDPYLVGTLATAFTRGLQGDGRYWKAASLLKHFLANSNEDGRDGSSSDFDTRLFHEYYAVPFRMAIEEGGADAFMTSYNAWNKVPMTANPVVRDVVMARWGFDGIVCTDAGALTNMVKAHHAYGTLAEAAAAAIHAGINQFLDSYREPLTAALAQHLLSEADLDRNLRGVYRVMFKLGMFDAAAQAAPPEGPPQAERRELVRRVTQESIVLLKNSNATLPLKAAEIKSIAVIGPLADKVALDWYSGTPPDTVTPLAGIRTRAGAGVKVSFATGENLDQAAELARSADVAVVVIGNHPTCDAGWNKCPIPSDGKEAVDRKSLTLEQEAIAEAVYAANPKTVLVLQASFPYTTVWSEEHLPAILEMTHNSEMQGAALADVLFGDYNPAGRLSQTWVRDLADLPPMMDYNLRDGRTYLYAKAKPLYAFGYGLSYTAFAYSALKISAAELHPGGELQVSVQIKNTGVRDGDEVVQLYVSHEGSAVARPLEELKGFRRVRLRAGDTQSVTIPLKASDLRYWSDAAKDFVLEKDAVQIRVGGSSDRLPLRQVVRVVP